MTPSDYEYLRKFLKERSGLDLSADKQYLVESRLAPLARKAGLSGIPELVQKMKPGDVTQPIRVQKGYQLFKLETMKTPTVQPFDSVRDLIGDKVAAARTQTEMRKFLGRLRAQAIIEWKNDELKKAYEKQIASEPVG